MGQQTLQTIIALSGRVDNSFGQIGEALIGVGNHVDALSQKIINFGKESVEEYVNYDDVMREVQALGEYDEKTMRTLTEYNRAIAQTSKYTMEQAGHAEVLMAQLGLNIDQTKTLMPTVMNLATAANIDLADSLDYLYYTLNALGLPMEYANTLSDQMSKTAAISAADIDTLGQSMQRLGSGAKFFAGGSSEILAILGGISQFGQDMQGTNAGTQLRNFMLTLLAPTKSKQTIMDAFSVSDQEWAEFETYMEDAGINVTETADAMNTLGLSVYDSSTGQLKPAIQIIGELNAALSTMSEAEQNDVLGKLFGKRTTTTALNLISSLSTIIDYQNQIESGSTGYTEAMAETMEGGLGGALREFTAAWSAFEVTIGETIAPTIEGVADGLTDIVNGLTNMDKDTLEAVVAGATTLAAAGPALMLAGGAFRLIGYALTPAGGIGLGLVALTAAAAALKELQEADFADNFGDMELDTESLSAYVTGLGEDFKASYTEVNTFKEALDNAVKSYETASTTFASDLLTSMLTGATLSETDKASLMSLGSDMHLALLEGITNSTAATMSYWEMLFGGSEEAPYDPDYQEIIKLTNTSYQNALAQAQSISQGFRDALTSAFDDGTISQEEYAELQKWMQSYNEAMGKAAAEAQDRENRIALEKLLYKSQTASFDSITEYAGMIQDARKATLADAENEYLDERSGLIVDGADQSLIDATDAKYRDHVEELNRPYDEALMRLWDYSIQNSDLASTYNELGTLADRVLGGELTAETAVKLFKDIYGNNSYAGEADFMGDNVRSQLAPYLARMITGYGGYEGLMDKVAYYEKLGDTESAAYLRRLYAMQQINDNFAETGVVNYDGIIASLFGDSVVYSSAAGEYSTNQAQKKEFLADIEGYITNYSVDVARKTVEAFSGKKNDLGAYFEAIGRGIKYEDGSEFAFQPLNGYYVDELEHIMDGLRSVYDFEKVLADESTVFAESGSAYRDYIAAYSLLYGNASQNASDYLIQAQVEPVVPEGAIQEAAGDATIPAEVVPETGGETEAVAIPAEVTGQTEAAADALADAQGVMDAGLTADASVTGLYASAVAERASAQAYLSANPGKWKVNTVRTGSLLGGLFAEGGRATVPSIFGEAGPEWAIPEEHTDRVASLFNAAREAAGFTWPELIERNGGLNAGGTTPTQIVYAPTIVANDASGVEQKLIEDKERLNQWWEEKKMRDDVEVFA